MKKSSFFYRLKDKLLSRQVWLTWCLSYLLILTISVSVSIYNHYKSNQIIMDEIASMSQLSLSGLANQADTTLETLSYLSSTVLSDPQVNALATASKASFPHDALRCMELFRQYRDSNLGLSMLCYAPFDEKLISYETANDADMLFPVVQNRLDEGMTLQQWKQRLADAAVDAQYLVSGNLSYSNVGMPSFVYAARTFGTAGNDRYVNLYVSLPCASLAGLSDSVSFVIADQSGSVLWDWNPQKLDVSLLEGTAFAAREGSSSIDVPEANTSYICTYLQSTVNPQWYYVQIIPSAQYYAHAHSLMRTLLLSLLVATLVGFAVAAAFVHHNYLPLSELLRLAGEPNGEAARVENEYDVIRGVVTNLQSENRTMREEQSLLRERLLDKYLLSLLIGRVEKQPDPDIVNQVEGTLGGKTVQITVMSFKPLSGQGGLAYHDVMSFAAENILLELLGERCGYFRLWDGGYLVWLFAGDPPAIDSLTGVLDQLYAVFDRAFPQVLTAAICDPITDLSQVSIAYAEALGAMQYMDDAGGNGFIRTRDLRARDGSSDDAVAATSGVMARKLVEAIRHGDSDEANHALGSLMQLTRSLQLPEPMLRHSLIALLNEPIGAFMQAFESDEQEKRVLDEKIEALNSLRAVEPLCAEMTALVMHLCQMVQRYSSERAIGFAERIAAYIDEHYTDPNLNITAIAEVMGVSSKTVSTRFRQATGEGILDYIAKVRVEHAKHIARDQQLSVERISEMVGYTSVKTFRRAFAKVEGATPGRFFQRLGAREEDSE